MNNKVVIIGGDHHNGLGLARSLGMNGVEVHAIVVSNIKNSFLGKSKYVNQCFVFPNEDEALDYIKTAYSEEFEKVVLIPYSDGAAKALDDRLAEFQNVFFVPSINSEAGKLCELMDKERQYAFAKEYGLLMASTDIIMLNEDKRKDMDAYPYPCILKPVISAEGDKKDITVCESAKDLEAALGKLREKGYYRILLQQYLSIDYEIDVFGCILKSSQKFCLVPTRTVRSWPSKGGTNSFSYIITDKRIIEKCKTVINALRDYGFYGLYDIELFIVGDQVYLNEINLRNSGDVYMALNQGYSYPFAWYAEIVGNSVVIPDTPERGDYCMTECADLRHVLWGNLKIFDWLKDFRKCSDFALRYKGDMWPAYNRYFYYLRKMVLRR